MSPLGRLALGAALAVTLALGLVAPDRSASFDVSLDVTTLATLPCGTPAGDALDGWCGDWATDPPRLPDAPHRAFAPFGTLRLVRVEGSAVRALQGRPFGDTRLALPCGEDDDLYYAGTYEGQGFSPGGQVLARETATRSSPGPTARTPGRTSCEAASSTSPSRFHAPSAAR